MTALALDAADVGLYLRAVAQLPAPITLALTIARNPTSLPTVDDVEDAMNDALRRPAPHRDHDALEDLEQEPTYD